jgi:hypothetical protein
MGGIMRALAGPETSLLIRTARVATKLPKAVRTHRHHVVALCEVAQMLSEQLGTPPPYAICSRT